MLWILKSSYWVLDPSLTSWNHVWKLCFQNGYLIICKDLVPKTFNLVKTNKMLQISQIRSRNTTTFSKTASLCGYFQRNLCCLKISLSYVSVSLFHFLIQRSSNNFIADVNFPPSKCHVLKLFAPNLYLHHKWTNFREQFRETFFVPS